MTKFRDAPVSRRLFAASLPAIGAGPSIGDRDRRPWRAAGIPLAVWFAGLLCACGQYDQSQCRKLKFIDYTFAVSAADFQFFVHDDGEIDEAECAALCDCLSPVPKKSRSGEVDAGDGGAGGTGADGGPGGPRCFSESDGQSTRWASCSYRVSAGGYRLLRCVGRTVTFCN